MDLPSWLESRGIRPRFVRASVTDPDMPVVHFDHCQRSGPLLSIRLDHLIELVASRGGYPELVVCSCSRDRELPADVLAELRELSRAHSVLTDLAFPANLSGVAILENLEQYRPRFSSPLLVDHADAFDQLATLEQRCLMAEVMLRRSELFEPGAVRVVVTLARPTAMSHSLVGALVLGRQVGDHTVTWLLPGDYSSHSDLRVVALPQLDPDILEAALTLYDPFGGVSLDMALDLAERL